MSLNIFIYNNHNILVRIVKQHCKKVLAMVTTKQHLQFIVWTQSNALTSMCIAFHQKACQTIAQGTDVKFTAWGYRDYSGANTDYMVPNRKTLTSNVMM